MEKVKYVITAIVMLCAVFALIFTLSHQETIVTLQSEETTIPKKVQLHFMNSWAGADTQAEKLEEVLKNFELENPDIQVINDSIGGEEFLFTLKTDFALGNDPDVFGLWPGSDIRALIKAGKVADLTDILREDKEWKACFGNDGWDYTTYEGRIYGLPIEIIYEGLFINKDLFEQYDVDVPTTYDKLVEAVKRFNQVGIIPIAYNSTPEGSYLYQNIVMKLGGKENTENPFDENGKIKINYINAIGYMKELYELGAFPEDAFTLNDTSRNELFVNKQAAMIVQGSWFIGEGYIDQNDETVDMIPFPSFQDGLARPTAITYGIGNGNFHMSASAWDDAEKKDPALRLLKDLTSARAAKVFTNQAAFISNIIISDQESKLNRLLKIGKSLVNDAEELIGPTDSFVDRNFWEETLIEKFPLILEGEISAEEVFGEMERKHKK